MHLLLNIWHETGLQMNMALLRSCLFKNEISISIGAKPLAEKNGDLCVSEDRYITELWQYLNVHLTL